MFRLRQSGPDRSDATAPYEVLFPKEYTVDQFLRDVLENRSDERGYIRIRRRTTDEGVSWFHLPCMEYRYGNVVSGDFSEAMKAEKICSAAASGGWGAMDYILKIDG